MPHASCIHVYTSTSTSTFLCTRCADHGIQAGYNDNFPKRGAYAMRDERRHEQIDPDVEPDAGGVKGGGVEGGGRRREMRRGTQNTFLC